MTTMLERMTGATAVRPSEIETTTTPEPSTRPTSVDRPSTEPATPTASTRSIESIESNGSKRSVRSKWRTWTRSRGGTTVDVRLVEESRHRAHVHGVWHLG